MCVAALGLAPRISSFEGWRHDVGPRRCPSCVFLPTFKQLRPGMRLTGGGAGITKTSSQSARSQRRRNGYCAILLAAPCRFQRRQSGSSSYRTAASQRSMPRPRSDRGVRLVPTPSTLRVTWLHTRWKNVPSDCFADVLTEPQMPKP